MPPPLTAGSWLTSWTVDWPSLVACLALGTGYVLATRRVAWPWTRTASFLAGLAVVLLSTCSFLGTYDDVLFWTRAVQNVLLLMGAPLLLAMGAPLSLVRAVAGGRQRAGWSRLGHSRAATVLTMPLVVTVALLLPLPLLYLTPLYAATLDHGVAGALVRVGLVGAGYVYYWTRLQVDPTPRGATHLASFAISFAEMLVDGAVGVIVWLGPLIAESHYRGVARDWGPSPRQDQTMGAVALWFGGDVIGIPYLVALFVQWFRAERQQAHDVDAALDAATEESTGLWWQTDARMTGRPGFGRPVFDQEGPPPPPDDAQRM